MPIVTTSASHKRPGRSPALPIAIAAVAIIAIVAVYLGTRASGLRQPQQVPDTTDKPAPTKGSAGELPAPPTSPPSGGPTSAAPTAPASPPSGDLTSAAPAAPTSPPSGGPAPEARPATVESPVKPKPKVFDNPVENELEELSRANGLGLRTPQVNMTHEETLEYLRKPVEIYDDDDPATVAAKERTAAMKTAALAYIEKGGTLNQFMRDYQAQAREDEATLKEVRNEMKRLLNDKGKEAAQAYLDEVNPQLKEAGLPEVRLSGLLVKAVERRKQREAEEAAAEGGGLR